jgi:DNA-binding MarR family transcriptional regulator
MVLLVVMAVLPWGFALIVVKIIVYAKIVATIVTMHATANKSIAAPAPQAVQPQGCTNLKLRQLMRRVAQHYDHEVGKTGLRGTQYSLLSYVYRLGPLRPGDLAREMKVDASTLTRNLKPLVAAGLLQMAAGADGRSRLVSITEAGRDKRVEAQRRWKTAQQGINEILGPQRVVALHALVDEALKLLSDPNLEAGEFDE